MASYWAYTFTQVAAYDAGFEAAVTAVAAGTMVIGFVMSNCTAGLITMAFMTMNPIIIIAVVALYLVLFVLFKKNKFAVREYLEKIALGDAAFHSVRRLCRENLCDWRYCCQLQSLGRGRLITCTI